MRKSVKYLNVLRNDLKHNLKELEESGIDLEETFTRVARLDEDDVRTMSTRDINEVLASLHTQRILITAQINALHKSVRQYRKFF